MICRSEEGVGRTFASAIELHGNSLVHELRKVEVCFARLALGGLVVCASASSASAAAVGAAAASATEVAASLVAAVVHCCVEDGGGGLVRLEELGGGRVEVRGARGYPGYKVGWMFRTGSEKLGKFGEVVIGKMRMVGELS